ncbi:UDP-glycosyltransferase 73C5 [Apostasia shenzhenica]|uniref:Glycosyltransferase n=1 Tax=Apostasia shenzhenica TaxID=1088818 RepID=A0A2I0A4C4_9ASPA|nr:UDP-glycosyltransferase 73C5 [Apostasia shenzhenica]
MEAEYGEEEASRQTILRGFLFPLPSPGHMIPLIDIAKLLSFRRVSVAVVTTPGNEPLVRPAIDHANTVSSSAAAIPIELVILPFPDSVSHLFPGDSPENFSYIAPSAYTNLIVAITALRPSLHDLLDDEEESKSVIVDGLPVRLELNKSEVSVIFQYKQMIEWMESAEKQSFGVVVNTFYELEPAYADLFRSRKAGRRAWFVGPVSLNNKDEIAMAERGGRASPDTARLMSWLDVQPVRSVVYACFGSLYELDAAQLCETAAGLEAAGHRFIWAVRAWEGAASAGEGWLPEGFEERVQGWGVLLKGWAPQTAILGHVAVGAFVTHCGWNSTLEGVAAGTPMVAVPLMYEQFINERLITDVLRIGVRAASVRGKGAVTAEEMTAALGRVMGDGEEAEEMRRRAREFAALARSAMEQGGSSYDDVGRMVEELRTEGRRVSAARGEKKAAESEKTAYVD